MNPAFFLLKGLFGDYYDMIFWYGCAELYIGFCALEALYMVLGHGTLYFFCSFCFFLFWDRRYLALLLQFGTVLIAYGAR